MKLETKNEARCFAFWIGVIIDGEYVRMRTFVMVVHRIKSLENERKEKRRKEKEKKKKHLPVLVLGRFF